MTQSQIARQIGRSQPEVSRLLRFRGTSPLARNLRRKVDLLFVMTEPLSLMQLGRLEQLVADLL